MTYKAYAHVVATFNFPGERDEVTDWVLDTFKSDEAARDVVISEFEVTRWSDPRKGTLILDASTGNGKYTLAANLWFFIDGGYKGAQRWLNDRLMRDEATTNMIIQTIKLSCAEWPDEE